MKIGSTLIVGAGGIGSHLAEPLMRLLGSHPNGKGSMLRVVDGDAYEEKNAERQMFPIEHVGASKSYVLANRVGSNLGALDAVSSEHGFVGSDVDAAGLMRRVYKDQEAPWSDALLVCLCVDNDATRRIFYDAMALLPKDHPDIVMLDCGNDLDTSTVVASFWRERKSKLVSPVEMYANLRDPKDRVPGGGCMEQAPSTPQLMVANMAAALSALLLVQALLDGRKFTDVVAANIRAFSMGVAGGEYGG